MKRALILITLSTMAYTCAAQSGWQDTTFRRHSIGVDISAFVYRYGGHSDSGAIVVAPSPYWLSYRYRLNKQWNLRAAVGGNFYQQDRPSMFADRDNYRIQKTQWALRAGIERAQELAKRWQIFYGLDLRSSWTHELNEERFSNGGYLFGLEENSSAIGPAAIFGIRFRITPRFNVLTEAGLSLMSTTRELREYSTPILGGEPQPDRNSKTTGLQSAFTPPLSVTATFAL